MVMKQRLIDALLGKEQQSQDTAPIMTYSPEVTDFVNRLGEQPYMQKLLNAPKEERLSLDEYKQGFTQGLNYGIPEIAKAQDELGVRKPQTDEEIALAQDGLFNKPNVVGVGISNAPRQGGIIRDFMGGLRENYNEGFDPRKLEPDNNKSWATRIGEGLGTAMRFADKPIGRFALATGLSALTGGASPLNEGIEAYVGRQNNMTKDRAYRQGLINMGVDEEQVNNIPGIMTDDVFKNLALANYRNNLTNYRNLKLDKDTYIKQQQNIYKMLDLGVIDSKEATRQMMLLNEEYDRQNPMEMQEGNRTVQGNRRLDIMENQGNERIAQGWKRLDLLQQKIENGQATEDEKEEYYDLRQRKLQLEIEELEEEKARRNKRGRKNKNTTASTNKGGTTKNGVKYEVLN